MANEHGNRVAGFNAGNNILVAIVSLAIYYVAGRGGNVQCAEDLAGWLCINGWVAAGTGIFASFLSIVRLCAFLSGNFLFLMQDPTLKLDGFVGGLAGLFLFIWWIVGQGRLWASRPCAPNELLSDPAERATCCDAGLWHATEGWFIFTYVILGLVPVLCCSVCCCMVASKVFGVGETPSKPDVEEGGKAASEEGGKAATEEGGKAATEATPLKQ